MITESRKQNTSDSPCVYSEAELQIARALVAMPDPRLSVFVGEIFDTTDATKIVAEACCLQNWALEVLGLRP